MYRRLFLLAAMIAVFAVAARAEIVVRKDGAVVHGKITRQNEQYIWMETKYGEQQIARASIVEIRKDDEIEKEFRERFEKACADGECHLLE